MDTQEDNADIKIEFFELDKRKCEEEFDENYTMPHGAMSGAGTFHSLTNVVNVRLNDKNIKIFKDDKGALLDRGDMSFYEYAEISRHIFYIDGKKHNINIRRWEKSDFALDSCKLDLLSCTFFDLNEINILLNKKELSNKDLVDLETNLAIRQNMPYYLRNFTSLNDLQRKIFENPDKLQDSTKAMFDLLLYASVCAEKHLSMNNHFHRLMETMDNLRNTNNHKFNMQFKEILKKIIMNYKTINHNNNREYWHLSTPQTTIDVLDRIEPLSRTQYSLPKYLKRIRQKIQNKFNPKKEATQKSNISKEKGVVNPKMSAEEKKTRLDIASQVLQSSKIKDITD